MGRPDPKVVHPFRVHDARGTARAVYGMGAGVAARTDALTVPDDVLARVRVRSAAIRSARRAAPSARRQLRMPRALRLLLFIALGGLVYRAVSRPASSPLVVGGFAAAVGLLVAYWALTRRGIRSASPGDVAEAFLQEGRCPACGYDIHAARAEPDGCTVCPECGAAWNLAPARTAAVGP